jgi:hypothetical protein
VGYVALSRAREATYIYVLDTTEAREVGAVEPAIAKPTIDDLALGMGRPAAAPLALDQVVPKSPPAPELEIDFP